jgi:hypothetical protein
VSWAQPMVTNKVQKNASSTGKIERRFIMMLRQ